MIHEERHRAGSFGEDAEQYDRARPSYPAALVDDLIGPGVTRVLDVGCGTGIAARLFADRGCTVVGVEQDPRMAVVAQRHGIDVRVAAFEAWAPPVEPFDLLVSGQAWHWVDPVVGPAKAARLLRAGGRFAAFWNGYSHSPLVLDAFAEIYNRHAPALFNGSVVLGTVGVERASGADGAALAACRGFEGIERRSYSWKRAYSSEEWVDQLPTHSDHRTLDPGVLAAVLVDVRRAIDRLGGHITVEHRTGLLTAHRVA